MRWIFHCAIAALLITLIVAQRQQTSTPADASPSHILSSEDSDRYRQLFVLERSGDTDAADSVARHITNNTLLGHALAVRYLRTGYNSSSKELAQWLEQYADYPQATAIHKLAQSKSPDSSVPFSSRRNPLSGYGYEPVSDNATPNLAALSKPGREEVKKYFQHITMLVRSGQITKAQNSIENARSELGMTPLEYDLCQWRIASAQMAFGQSEKAYQMASAIAARGHVPQADWIAGLIAWKRGDKTAAAQHFTNMAADDTVISPWQSSAAHFWAYRAMEAAGNPDAFHHLQQAASHPRTFYGIIAAKQLNQPLQVDNRTTALSDREMANLLGLAGVKRAMALASIGETDLAESELRALYPRLKGHDGKRKLLGLAEQLHLPTLQMLLGRQLASGDNRYDAALYPIPNWQPEAGFNIDPALIFAFARKESAFHTSAKSPAGAMGIMQIMPATAHYVSMKNEALSFSAQDVYEPITNITLGESYLAYLLHHGAVEGKLFLLAAAYNAGPGKVMEWKSSMPTDDPLLFVEAIPYPETRSYVREVMASYWIYSERLGNQVSIDGLAQGTWPTYTAQLTTASR